MEKAKLDTGDLRDSTTFYMAMKMHIGLSRVKTANDILLTNMISPVCLPIGQFRGPTACLKCITGQDAPKHACMTYKEILPQKVFSIRQRSHRSKKIIICLKCDQDAPRHRYKHLHRGYAQRDVSKIAMGKLIGTNYHLFEVYQSTLHQSKPQVL